MTGRLAAIVPAAGESRRMGRPKLVLPIEGTAVVARVVRALIEGGVDRVVVVAPPRAAVASEAVQRAAAVPGPVVVVVPETQPPDMRASVALAVATLAGYGGPWETVLLAPADSPGLNARLVAMVAAAARADPGRLVVPTVRGRRGHPVALPWHVALEVLDLPDDRGVNALVARHARDVVELAVEDPAAVEDLDTPEDYRRWSDRG